MSSNLNLNKAAAAVLSAGLIAMLTGKITEFLYDGGSHHAGAHESAPRGYKIEVVETASAGEAAAPKGPGDVMPMFAGSDVAAGGDYVSKRCTSCHSIDKGGVNRVGPYLWGVFNRPAASVADFNYSAALKSHAGEKWDYDMLNHFLWSPSHFAPGTMMSFAGIPKDQERANVIAYLATQLTDTPATLPKVNAGAKADAKDAAKPAGK